MIRSITYSLLFLLLASPGALYAQGTELEGDDIDVVKEYKPVLADAIKEKFLPRLPEITFSKADLDYQVPTRLMDLPYVGLRVKPLSMRRERHAKLYRAFVKAGYGNYGTPLVEGYFNNTRDKKYHYGIFAGHTSSNNDKNVENQQNSETYFGANGKYMGKKNALYGEMGYWTEGINYYGYNDSLTFAKSAVEQSWSGFNADFRFKNTDHTAKWDHDTRFRLNTLSDNDKARETNIELNFGTAHKLQTGDRITIDFDLRSSSYKNELVIAPNVPKLNADNSFAIIGLTPRYVLGQEKWNVAIGIKPVIEMFKDSTQLHVIPDLVFTTTLIEKKLTIVSGIVGEIQANSLLNLSRENPFVSSWITRTNTKHEDIFVRFHGALSKKFSYLVEGTWRRMSNQALFVGEQAFTVGYDSGQAIIAQAEVAYRVNEKLRTGLVAAYYSFDMDRSAQAWQLPALRTDLDIQYNMGDKLLLKAALVMLMDRYALKADGTEEKLDDVIDANFALTYKYSKNISLFCNLNNLTGQAYHLWYQYPSYGFNFVAGLAFSF